MYKDLENLELQREEETYLLRRFLAMTMQEKLNWHCTYFAPVSFILAEDEEQSPDAFLSQLFTVNCQLNGVDWELSVWESIKIPSGQGLVRLTGERAAPGQRHIEVQYTVPADHTDAESMQHSDPVVAQLAGAILKQIEQSDTVREAYTWATFNVVRNVPNRYLRHPLYKLGKKLLADRQALAFHRCILDKEWLQN